MVRIHPHPPAFASAASPVDESKAVHRSLGECGPQSVIHTKASAGKPELKILNSKYYTVMPFLVLGIIVLLLGAYFMRMGIKMEYKELLIGSIALIIAGLILIVFFGLFYRSITLFGA